MADRGRGPVVGTEQLRSDGRGAGEVVDRRNGGGGGIEQEEMQLALGGERFGQLEERRAAGERGDAEHRESRGSSGCSVPARKPSSSAGKRSGGLGSPMHARVRRQRCGCHRSCGSSGKPAASTSRFSFQCRISSGRRTE